MRRLLQNVSQRNNEALGSQEGNGLPGLQRKGSQKQKRIKERT